MICFLQLMKNEKGNNSLVWVEKFSRLLDSSLKIGNFRFGLDPILNLIPFAGNGATTLMSLALVFVMKQHGASSKLAAKMLGNVLLDFFVGAIPILGWIFDFYFKANNRNVKLLKEHYAEGKHQGSAKGYLSMILIIFCILILLAAWGMWALGKWLWSVFS